MPTGPSCRARLEDLSDREGPGGRTKALPRRPSLTEDLTEMGLRNVLFGQPIALG